MYRDDDGNIGEDNIRRICKMLDKQYENLENIPTRWDKKLGYITQLSDLEELGYIFNSSDVEWHEARDELVHIQFPTDKQILAIIHKCQRTQRAVVLSLSRMNQINAFNAMHQHSNLPLDIIKKVTTFL